MIKMKNYWGVFLIAFTVLMSSCQEDEEFISSYNNYGNVYVNSDESILVDVDGFMLLQFSEESMIEFGDDIEHGQRIVVNYEVEETIAENTYLIKVLSMADVDRKKLDVHSDSDTATIVHTLVYESPMGIVVSGTNVNMQVQYLKDHEENELQLIYKPSMQEEGKDVKLVLVNVFEGEELEEEDKTTGFDITTFDIGEITSLYTPNREGDSENIYFEIIINPNSYSESTFGNLYVPAM